MLNKLIWGLLLFSMTEAGLESASTASGAATVVPVLGVSQAGAPLASSRLTSPAQLPVCSFSLTWLGMLQSSALNQDRELLVDALLTSCLCLHAVGEAPVDWTDPHPLRSSLSCAGTEVAKEAADIVILDDNFNSIVKSVLWGRSVFANLRKFLQFQLTINFAALVIAFVAAVTSGETPLNVLELLWINLIMDALAALGEGPVTCMSHVQTCHGSIQPPELQRSACVNLRPFLHKSACQVMAAALSVFLSWAVT